MSPPPPVNAQTGPALRIPMDSSPPGSSVHGIFQARNTGVGLQFPIPGDFSNPGIEIMSLVSHVLAGYLLIPANRYLLIAGIYYSIA